MTTATDIMPGEAPSVMSDIPSGFEGDDEDAAGYQAMMSELPTIVSMSGLLDGEFDELHEIQNLLAPVSDDDDEGNAAAAAAKAAEDAYIQSMVPNPIPTGDLMSGLDVSAKAAALDEDLGFPSGSLVTTDAVSDPTRQDVSTAALSVRAPSKRVHQQIETGLVTPVDDAAHRPKLKQARVHTKLAQTPAKVRTSLDGVSAPNPLLFGRAIQLPSHASMDSQPPTKVATTKATLKPKSTPKVVSKRPQALCNTKISIMRSRYPTKPRTPQKFVAPELVLSYPVPACLVTKTNSRPPLCKLIIKATIHPFGGSPEAAIARVPAPPILKTQPTNSSSGPGVAAATVCKPKISATASKKKASNKKKKKKKKTSVVKFKKHPSKPSSPQPGAPSKNIPEQPEQPLPMKVEPVPVPVVSSAPAEPAVTPPPPGIKMEELMVANPLANILPAEPLKAPSTELVKMPPPAPKPKTAPSQAPTAPRVKTPCPLQAPTAPPTTAPSPLQALSAPPAKAPSPLQAPSVPSVSAPSPLRASSTSSVIAPSPLQKPSAPPMAAPCPLQAPSSTPAAVVSSVTNSSVAGEAPKTSATADTPKVAKPSNRAKPLTAEQRAQACRDRNRQHARNTRLRKKAYIEELKRALLQFAGERDRDIAAQKEQQSRKEQARHNRKRVLQDFLQLRGHNDQEEAKWAKLVKDAKSFELTLPVISFQSVVETAIVSASEQVLSGVQDVMTDASYFASLLQSLGANSSSEGASSEKTPVYFQYDCDEKPFFMDGTMGLLGWKATSCGAVAHGANAELLLSGTIRASFCPDSDKLVSVKLMFDTGLIQAQLSRQHV